MTEAEKHPIFQALMDGAYDRWSNYRSTIKTQQDFWDQLTLLERPTVFLGNMNYQVQNGGFVQWWDNRYATQETVPEIRRYLRLIDTEASRKALDLVTRFWSVLAQYDWDVGDEEWESFYKEADQFSSQYYVIDDQLLDDIENWLYNQIKVVKGIPLYPRLTEEERAREVARGGIERHLGDVAADYESPEAAADAIYTEALTLAQDALANAGFSPEITSRIAQEEAQKLAQP